MKRFLITLLFVISPAIADDPFKVISVIDGDTLRLSTPWVPDPLPKTLSLRIYGVNTPELRSINPVEKQAAIKAKTFVENLLKTREYTVEIRDWDKYARLLGDIKFSNGELLSEILIKEHIGYAYLGIGSRPAFQDSTR